MRRLLERLPYYGVFDYIVFRVDRGTVYLAGYSFEGRLKADAATAAKRASGVDEVANKIEVLPASQNDDQIRWATFYRIYTDDCLSRYAPGGVQEVLRELRDERHFPGMQPHHSLKMTLVPQAAQETRLPFGACPRSRNVLINSPSPHTVMPERRLYHSPSGTSGSVSSHVASN